jgi:poly(3-hydroxyalkanoate) synthetase
MDSSKANLEAQNEIAPADADELARWLEQRRERAKQYHEVHMSWLNELDRDAKEIIQSICHGC